MLDTLDPPAGARANRAGERRRHLLDTARALFVENGFHRTGMAQIATASGIKVGQIYRDFESKEDIIAALCEADVAAWLQEDVLTEAVERNDLKAIRAWIGRFGSAGESVDGARMMAEIVAEAWRNPRIAEINRSIDQRVRRGLGSALAALAGGPTDADERALLVDLILAIGFGLEMRRIAHPELNVTALSGNVSAMIDRAIDDFCRR